jgi:membrane-associated phospholipid phosphatase
MSLASGVKSMAGGGSALQRMLANARGFLALLVRETRVPAHRGLLWPLSGRIVSGALITIAALILIMFIADAWAIRQARTLPQWLVDVFNEITDFGRSGWFLWPLAAGLLLAAVVSSMALPRFALLAVTAISVRLSFLFIAIALPSLFVTIIKRVIGRGRPFVSGEADPFVYGWLKWTPSYASFPSGHATTAFAAAFAIGALWPRARPVLWIYAIIIALSRVIITAHHPSDVVAGAIVGVVGALLVRDWFAARRLAFAIGPDGRVRARPGPSFRRVKRLAQRVLAQ